MAQAVQPSRLIHWKSNAPIDQKKPTITFIHAAWMDMSMWDEAIGLLVPSLSGSNLIQVDLNGHGRSTYGKASFTLWDQAKDVLHLLNAMIVGVSMGAMVAARAALLDQARVNSLVLLGVSLTAPTEAMNAQMKQMRDIWVSTPVPSEDIMNIAIRAWGGNPDINGERSKQVKRCWVEIHSGAEGVDPVLNCMNGREDILDRLSEIRVPVLIAHGTDDQTYPYDRAEATKDAFKNSKDVELVPIQGSGHLVIHMREPSDVAELISTFAAKVFAL